MSGKPSGSRPDGPQSCLEVGEVRFAVRTRSVLARSDRGRLVLAQLDAADLAGDRLWKLGELEQPDPLVRREMLAAVLEDLERRLLTRLVPGSEDDERLRHRQPDRVRRRDDGGLSN